MPRLRDVTKVLRSKNAGPFALTYDILFDSEEQFQKAVASGVFSPQNMGKVLKYPSNAVRVLKYPPAYAIKITVPRRHPSGAFDDTDVFGCQQHAPLLDVDVP
jgi:hypothetical protein